MKWKAMKWRAVGFLGVVSVVLAAILLVGSVERHRIRVSAGWPVDTRWVLVAKQRIPKGTPGSYVVSQSL